jgi:hypothetical protein
MKIRLDQNEGLDPGNAIEIEARNRSPSGCVSVTIWNGATHTSVELPAERARQVAMALISAFGGGGDAGE